MQYDAFADWVRQTSFAGLPLWNLMLALAAAVASYAVIGLLLRLLTGRAKTWASLTDGAVARTGVDVLEGTSRPLMLVLALLIGASLLDLPGRWENRLNQLWFVAMALQMGLWGRRAIDLGVHRYLERHGPANAATGTAQQVGASATLLSWGLRSLLWSVVLLAILSNVGVNITAFIASLGVGGIAVALAVQNILGDLFASLAIAVDKPFEVGDFITVGSISGTVQVIGLKTTRIRSLQGEQIVVSNTDLLKQTISNFRLLETRRIVFGFGVAYGTTPEQAQAIPGLVRRLIEAQPKLRFDRAHFKAFGASSLDYEVVYFVEDPAYGVYMDLQQSINLGLMRELQALGVEFAVPTRTLHIASAPTQGPGSDLLAAR
ncbi:mechanosensitive ion channel family protein [Verminephrobacter eiseniae]|uniref:mechanosensitive ion channel family protein n=1 Tax=Verminephrobacter eiseniae TaxID=364317 RepID=UPI0010E452AC|nr:mechanosensitive ion channel family protein [Verminephrobacter eiseniae]KAB7584271.1 mechanosensitive ion channel family protein [Verminephrobacter sp. Larva24]MCW5232995.1 mechanosensitive ion channel family protein [Verminephrobacter eiseniae]MCW5295449.1 mechanosensitive ion channel family protein [Verminephrobacter eiseniae]MCW8185952.1 mechanosensitive ion channel family protein [Verminephrobacter eiseniae]MCW8224215.1 mechanosensitive ion channel family protein [Verminephrobacter eise